MDRLREQKLLRRAAAGDRAAAEACIRAHQDSVYAYVLRLSGCPEMAQDITQEAFVRVLTHLDRYDPTYRFSTWVFTIARRLYINARRKSSPIHDSALVAGSQRDDADAPGRAAGEDQTRVLLHALSWIGADQREAVVLFHCHGWTVGAIAEHMALPPGTVKSHLHRGRRELRRLLSEEAHHDADVRQEATS